MVAQLTGPCVQNESKSAGFWLEKWPTRHENCLLCFSNNASFRELYECEGIWQLGVHGMYRTVDLSIVAKLGYNRVSTFYEYICIHAVFRIRIDFCL
jgi:hypothetical protein